MAAERRVSARVLVLLVVCLLIGTGAALASQRGWPGREGTLHGPPPASRVGEPIRVGGSPVGIAYDPVNKLLFVTSQENVSYGSSYNLTSINASSGTVERSIQLPSPAGTIAVDAEDGSVYVGSPGNSIYAINGSTGMVTSNIPAGCPQGCFPEVQTYDSANEEVFVTDLGNNNLTVVRNSTFLSSFYVGSAPNGAAYDSANHDIYVANEGSYDLTVVNGSSDTPAEEVAPVVTGPGVAYDPRAGSILVCSNNASNPLNPNFVTAVNGSSNRIVARIPVIASCGGVAFDPSNGYVYVTNEILDLNLSWGSSVTVIDPESNEVVAGLPAGLNPIGIAYDPENEGSTLQTATQAPSANFPPLLGSRSMNPDSRPPPTGP